MSSSPSRSPSASYSPRSSRSVSPKYAGSSRYINFLYQPKTYNTLVSLCILFLICIISFLLFDVRKTVISPNCQCESHQYYNGHECVNRSEIKQDMENITMLILHSLKKENITFAELKNIDKSIADLDDQIIYLALYQLNYFVNSEGNINSCHAKESCLGYEIAVVILFIICFALTFISFIGRQSRY